MVNRILLCGLVGWWLSFAGAPSVYADLQVNLRIDKVILKDGTEIECIVLMVTSKAVLIAETDPADPTKARQRVIPADTVEKIIRGEAVGEVTGFHTDKELLQKVIQGSGFRKEEAPAAKEQKGPLGPKANEAEKEGRGKHVARPTDAQPSTSKIGAKELADAYLSRFPALKTAAQNLIGLVQTPQLIEQAQKGDPLVRKQVVAFLLLVLNSNAGMPDEKNAAPAAKTPPPAPLPPNNDQVAPPAPKPAVAPNDAQN